MNHPASATNSYPVSDFFSESACGSDAEHPSNEGRHAALRRVRVRGDDGRLPERSAGTPVEALRGLRSSLSEGGIEGGPAPIPALAPLLKPERRRCRRPATHLGDTARLEETGSLHPGPKGYPLQREVAREMGGALPPIDDRPHRGRRPFPVGNPRAAGRKVAPRTDLTDAVTRKFQVDLKLI